MREGSEHPSLAHKRVLVVDDEDDARELLRYILEPYQAYVLDAANVADALEVLRCTPVDVIVSDIGMPERDGYSFIHAVRSDTGTQGIPAIALTAYTSRGDQVRALRAGFDLHLAKPFDARKLVETLADLVVRAPRSVGSHRDP